MNKLEKITQLTKELDRIELGLLQTYVNHLKGVLERENDIKKKFALVEAISGLQDYLKLS